MRRRRHLKRLLKTVPGKIAAVLLTAVIGAAVAYFAPGILDSLTGKDELQISVQTDYGQIDTFDDLSHTVIVPRGKRATGSPGRGCSGFHAWSVRVGAVPATRSDFRLVVQGGSEEVYIGGIRARLIERRDPIEGTGFQCPSAGAAEIRRVLIDLDQPGPAPPGVWEVGEAEKSISFTIAPGETEVFDVTAHTEGCYCIWVLELVTTQGGEEKLVTIDDGGSPFETTTWGGGSEWSSYPTELPPVYTWNWEGTWIASGSEETKEEYRAGAEPLPPLATVGRLPG